MTLPPLIARAMAVNPRRLVRHHSQVVGADVNGNVGLSPFAMLSRCIAHAPLRACADGHTQFVAETIIGAIGPWSNIIPSDRIRQIRRRGSGRAPVEAVPSAPPAFFNLSKMPANLSLITSGCMSPIDSGLRRRRGHA